MQQHNADYAVWRRINEADPADNRSISMKDTEAWTRYQNGLTRNRVALRLWALVATGRLPC